MLKGHLNKQELNYSNLLKDSSAIDLKRLTFNEGSWDFTNSDS